MKEERSKKLYDAITEVDDDLIEAAQAKAARRSQPWVKWAALAACLVIVLAAAITLWPGRGSQAPQLEPGISQEPSDPQKPGEISGPYMEPDGEDGPVDVTPVIEAFGESSYTGDMAVANGERVNSDALEGAMREYGDTVRYRVMIELFHDGVQIDSAGEIARREGDKLADTGYTFAMETYDDGYVQHHYFTIHATAEQIRNYPLDGGLGYSFLLFGEYFGEMAGVPAETNAFNGADILP